jgi:hypothetical protein
MGTLLLDIVMMRSELFFTGVETLDYLPVSRGTLPSVYPTSELKTNPKTQPKSDTVGGWVGLKSQLAGSAKYIQ